MPTASTLGIYRKSHIPESPGYHEKFYFSPGDTGFKVWPTRYGTLGVAVCWDQWFPETARAMALMGAEILFYPTAIGSEPQDPTLDSRYHWQRTMQGHAAANVMPLVASNRIGTEKGEKLEITFYGHSFIADHTGAIVAQADDHSEQIITGDLRPRGDPPLSAFLGRVPRPAAGPLRPAHEAGRWPRLSSALAGRVACVDLETTGGHAARDRVIEAGIVLLEDGEVVEEYSTLVNPGTRIPYAIQQFTGITEAMVADAPPFEAVADDIAVAARRPALRRPQRALRLRFPARASSGASSGASARRCSARCGCRAR